MGTYVRKLLPCSLYEVDALQVWLEKLAAQGLILRTLSLRVAKFEKTEPKQVRYLVDVAPRGKRNADGDMIAFYRECGWDYVTRLFSRCYLFRSEDPAAAEAEADRAGLYRHLQGVLFRRLLLVIVLTLFCPIPNLPFFTSDYPLTDLVSNGTLCYLLFFVLVLCLVGFLILESMALWRLRKNLLSAEAGGTVKPSRPQRLSSALMTLCPVCLVCCLLVLLLGQSLPFFGTTGFSASVRGPVPFPTLAEISPQDWDAIQAQNTAARGQDAVDLTPSFFRARDLLAPTIDTMDQGNADLLVPQDPQSIDETQRIAYQVHSYRFLTEPLAARFAREQVRSHQTQDQIPLESISAPGIAYAAYAAQEANMEVTSLDPNYEPSVPYSYQSGEFLKHLTTKTLEETAVTQTMILQQGKQVYWVYFYNGSTDLRSRLDLFAQSLQR